MWISPLLETSGIFELANGIAGITSDAASVSRRSPPRCLKLFGPHSFPLRREAFRSFINRVFPKQGEKKQRWDLRRIVWKKL